MPRHNYIQVRLDDDEKAACEKLAGQMSLSLAAWVRHILRGIVSVNTLNLTSKIKTRRRPTSPIEEEEERDERPATNNR